MRLPVPTPTRSIVRKAGAADMRVGLRRLGAVLLILPLLHACGADRASPEERIRQLLDSGEQAVESRSISAVSPLFSAAYSGRDGHDKRALLRLLAGYFVSHQSIHLLTQVSRLELTGDADPRRRAQVTLFVAVAGQPIASSAQLLSLRADLIRLDLSLILEEDEWRVLHAAWRRAEAADFLE